MSTDKMFSSASEDDDDSLRLYHLPNELIETILSYMTFEEISQLRMVDVKFNIMCKKLLNQGFRKVDKLHAQIQRDVRALLPRRESERRSHRLARHTDILASVETRLSLLGMTYVKYMDTEACCFIPGKVLDELFRILLIAQNTEVVLPRAHDMLQELRDISSMAMEHFEETIVPQLKKKSSLTVASTMAMSNISGIQNYQGPSQNNSSRFSTIHQDIVDIGQHVKTTNGSVRVLKKEMMSCKGKLKDQERKIIQHERRINEQNQVIQDQNRKLAEQDLQISDLSKKLVEQSKKLELLFSEFVKPPDVNANTGRIQVHNMPQKEHESVDPGFSTTYDNLNNRVISNNPSVEENVSSGMDSEVTGQTDCRKRKLIPEQAFEQCPSPIASPIANRVKRKRAEMQKKKQQTETSASKPVPYM